MFSFDRVTSTYNGQDRACRCGCKGSYAKPDAMPKLAQRRWKQVMHQHSMFPVDADLKPFGDEVHLNLSLPNNRAVTVYFRV